MRVKTQLIIARTPAEFTAKSNRRRLTGVMLCDGDGRATPLVVMNFGVGVTEASGRCVRRHLQQLRWQLAPETTSKHPKTLARKVGGRAQSDQVLQKRP